MTLLALPLHPLVVHAAVVLVPLIAIGAMLWAVRVAWGWWLRLPVLIGAVVAAALAFWTVGFSSPLPGGRRRATHWPVLAVLGRVLLVLSALAVGVTVFLTGDSGARMVWDR